MQYFKKVFSAERMQRYLDAHQGNEAKAILHYRLNIEVSESFYPTLSVLEVALRNAIDKELRNKFQIDEWYSRFATTPGLANLIEDITSAQQKISRRNELITPSKIVAELTLGFWVRLFNREFELILWKDLRKAFPFMPKQHRQRGHISAPLNNVRTLRNRIFHNEPILWNFNRLQEIHSEILTVIGWINKDIPAWIQPFDRFDAVLNDVKNKLH
jgi:hypothetical protein